MDYMKLKLAIYESYGNGEMTSEACSHLIDSLDMKYGESIADEAANAENDFINASLKVFTESTGEEVLTEAAKNFGAKIKAAWEKFKAWVKKIIDKILNLGKGKVNKDTKISVPKEALTAQKNGLKAIDKLKSAKNPAAVAAAIAGIVTATAAIIKCKDLKKSLDKQTIEYEKFKEDQANLINKMKEAAEVAHKQYEHGIDAVTQHKDEELSSANNKIAAYKQMIDDLEKELKQVNSELSETRSKLDSAGLNIDALNDELNYRTQRYDKLKEKSRKNANDYEDQIYSLKDEISDLEQKLKEAVSYSTTLKNALQKANKESMDAGSRAASLRAQLSSAKKTSQDNAAESAKYAALYDTCNANLRRSQDQVRDLQSKLRKAKSEIAKLNDANPTRNSNGEVVSNSQILSAATKFINAVSSTTTALLPAISTKSADEMNAIIDSDDSTADKREGHTNFDDFSRTYTYMDNAISNIRKAKDNGETPNATIKVYINRLLASAVNTPYSIRKKLETRLTDTEKDATNTRGIRFDLNQALRGYDLDTPDGIRKFVNDIKNKSGVFKRLIDDANDDVKMYTDLCARYKAKLDDNFPDKLDMTSYNNSLADYKKALTSFTLAKATIYELDMMKRQVKRELKKYN